MYAPDQDQSRIYTISISAMPTPATLLPEFCASRRFSYARFRY